jgi:hypothetical protein
MRAGRGRELFQKSEFNSAPITKQEQSSSRLCLMSLAGGHDGLGGAMGRSRQAHHSQPGRRPVRTGLCSRPEIQLNKAVRE